MNRFAAILSVSLLSSMGLSAIDVSFASPAQAQVRQSPKPSFWKLLSPPESGFSITMPGDPQTLSQPAKLPTGDTVNLIGYLVNRPSDRERYLVMYGVLPFAVKKEGQMGQKIVTASLEKAMQIMHAEVISQQTLALNGYAGREVTFRVKGGVTGKWRVFLVEDHLYQLVATSASDAAASQNIDTFLSSFKLEQH